MKKFDEQDEKIMKVQSQQEKDRELKRMRDLLKEMDREENQQRQ